MWKKIIWFDLNNLNNPELKYVLIVFSVCVLSMYLYVQNAKTLKIFLNLLAFFYITYGMFYEFQYEFYKNINCLS